MPLPASDTVQSARIGFAGTPDFAAVALRHLVAAGFRPALVLTQPDRPAGRGRKVTPSAVKTIALDENLTLAQPTSLKSRTQVGELALDTLDILIVAAYGLLLPTHVLAAPRVGCVNIHASLLPRWRGAAPIAWAIASGDERTGVCLMQMEKGLDTGPVFAEQATPIRPQDTAASLHDRLAQLGGDLLVRHLPALLAGTMTPAPQPDAGATYARKLQRADGQIDWMEPAAVIDQRIRGFNPYPGCVAECGGQPLKIWQSRYRELAHTDPPGTVLAIDDEGIVVAAGVGAVVLTEVQRPGKGRIDAVALASQLDLPGTRLGNGA